jgi:catechol 2,3-dioxygenase-like lactoylglutathione lyase family enzyme
MKARLSLVTLGVRDLQKARAFYCDGLGFKASSASNEHVVFIQVGALALALWDRLELAKDARVAADFGKFGGFSLAQNYGSRTEVDEALELARRAGAKILKPAEDTFWGGYSGYFADPDEHVWEVAFNPFWPLDAHGNVTLPA